MTTGAAWDLSDPEKPTADFRASAERDLPFNWADWLADIGSTAAGHEVSAAEPLSCTAGTRVDGVVTSRVKVTGAFVPGTKYPITCRISAADGQKDSQTLWLRVLEH
jgi:hypothetical protein